MITRSPASPDYPVSGRLRVSIRIGQGEEPINQSSLYERIYDLVRQIPAGRVSTYGRIARLAGGCSARQVGYAMAALPAGSQIPWHRVINSQGRISIRKDGYSNAIARRLLEEEGLCFDRSGGLDLGQVLWSGPEDRPLPKQLLPLSEPDHE